MFADGNNGFESGKRLISLVLFLTLVVAGKHNRDSLDHRINNDAYTVSNMWPTFETYYCLFTHIYFHQNYSTDNDEYSIHFL